MTGPEHYAEAQLLLLDEACEYACPHSGCPHEAVRVARAQAHATLALAAATALIGREPGSDLPEWNAWRDVAGGQRERSDG